MRLLAATLVPLTVLGIVELGLRFAGYGYPTTFFRPSRIGGEDFLIPNERFGYRFFPAALARDPVPGRMAAAKPAGTYRIFLFGESAAFGDPDPSFGVGRWLKVLLEERYPSNKFEVVCVAMTAINSHAILPIARECARYDGDLWVVYMGNNEMVGPYGASTVFGTRAPPLGVVRASLALKQMRTGQLLDSLLAGLCKGPVNAEDWTGINLFRDNPLRHDDPARLRAYENFNANLEDLLNAGREAGVPILLSTVASNLKDCAPFASLHARDLSPAQLEQWTGLFQAGKALEDAGDYPAALGTYSNAAALDADFAELRFRLGRCHLALTNTEEALRAFARARDQDALCVRADTRINRLLADAARRHAADRVVEVDAASLLANCAPGGVPGNELFFEHVHFTLEGNYQLARLFADHLADLLPPSISAGRVLNGDELEACRRRLAVTLWDQKRLWTEALKRVSAPPFTAQITHGQSVRHVQHQLQRVNDQLAPETPRREREVYEAALARAPDDVLLRGNYAQFLEVTGARAAAIQQGQQVCELLPDLAWPHYYVGALLAREGRAREAAECFERALAIRSDFLPARRELIRLGAPAPR